MVDEEKASELAKKGLDLWEDGQLDGAANCFRKALRLFKRSHYRTPDCLQSLACILSAMGQDNEALTNFREALQVTLEQEPESSPSIAMARYFLAEHLLNLHHEVEALSYVRDSLPNATGQEALLRTVEADCLWLLGRKEDAIKSALQAVKTARSDEQLEGIRERLRHILSFSHITGND